MMKLTTPKRVTLPNGRTFLARYKRVKRSELPPNNNEKNLHAKRAAPSGRQRRVRAQQGQGIFDFVKKIAKIHIVKGVAKKGLEYAPGTYRNLTKRVKNKTLKRILNSDATHSVLNSN